MESIGALIDSIAQLLWPLIVIGVLLTFRIPLSQLLQSLSRRSWSLSVAGTEVSLNEVGEQSIELLADLSARMTEIEASMSATGEAPVSLDVEPTSANILWLDESPERRALLISALERAGHRITMIGARSRSSVVEPSRFDMVLAVPKESESWEETLQAIEDLCQRRVGTDDGPMAVVYASSQIALLHGRAAEQKGIRLTSRPGELWKWIGQAAGGTSG